MLYFTAQITCLFLWKWKPMQCAMQKVLEAMEKVFLRHVVSPTPQPNPTPGNFVLKWYNMFCSFHQTSHMHEWTNLMLFFRYTSSLEEFLSSLPLFCSCPTPPFCHQAPGVILKVSVAFIKIVMRSPTLPSSFSHFFLSSFQIPVSL